MIRLRHLSPFLLLSLGSCSHSPGFTEPAFPEIPGETHLKNIHQLTHGGTNAEAYWSFDGRWLSFQHSGGGPGEPECDQIYRMRLDGTDRARVSDGRGRTNCSFFTPDNSRIL